MAHPPLKMKNGLGNNNDLEKITYVWVVPLTKRFSSSFLNLTIFPLSPILPFFLFFMVAYIRFHMTMLKSSQFITLVHQHSAKIVSELRIGNGNTKIMSLG